MYSITPGYAKGTLKILYRPSTKDKDSEMHLVTVAKLKEVPNLPVICLLEDIWKLSDGARPAFLKNGGAVYDDMVLQVVGYPAYMPVQALFVERIDMLPVMVDQMLDCKPKLSILLTIVD